METDPKLVVMVGFPRAGKSTFVRDYYLPRGYSIVSPDTLRRVIHGHSFVQAMEHYVWSVVYAMTDSLLACGNKVVVDGTHISHRRRESWVERGAVFHHIGTSVETCLTRAAAQSNACDIIPIIKSMAEEFEPLGEGEIAWEPDQTESATTITQW